MTYFQGLKSCQLVLGRGPTEIDKGAADDRGILPRQTFRIPPGRWLPQWAELWSLPPLPCGRSQSQAGSLPRYLGVSGRYIWAIQRVVWANALFKKKLGENTMTSTQCAKNWWLLGLQFEYANDQWWWKSFEEQSARFAPKSAVFFCEESYQEGLHSLVGATQVAWIISLLDC